MSTRPEGFLDFGQNPATKLPNKQYVTHTRIQLYGKTVYTMVLTRSFQDHASPSEFGKIHESETAQINFYIGGTDPCSSTSLEAKNRIVELMNTMFSQA